MMKPSNLIAQTPTPPYYAVVFTSVRTESDKGYAEMAVAMAELAAKQPGYLGMESARGEGRHHRLPGATWSPSRTGTSHKSRGGAKAWPGTLVCHVSGANSPRGARIWLYG